MAVKFAQLFLSEQIYVSFYIYLYANKLLFYIGMYLNSKCQSLI